MSSPMQARKCIENERVIFDRIETADMTHNRRIINKAKFLSDAPTNDRIIGISVNVNAVFHYLEIICAKHPFSRLFTTSEQIGSKKPNKGFANHFQWVFKVSVLAAAVRVCHSHNSTMSGSCCERFGTHTVKLSPHDLIWVLSEEII